MILALLATLGAIVTAFVLYPVFTEAPATGRVDTAALDENERELSNLSDKKAMLYETLQDLDFDKAAGKITSSDYETSRNDYLAQVAAVMERMDALAPSKPSAKKSSAKKSSAKKPSSNESSGGELACPSCGTDNPTGSKFCLECGEALAGACASCGESLPPGAKFCNACGDKVTS